MVFRVFLVHFNMYAAIGVIIEGLLDDENFKCPFNLQVSFFTFNSAAKLINIHDIW